MPDMKGVPFGRWRKDVVALAFLALVTVAFFWKILLTADYTILSGYDGAVQWYAWYRFAAHWLRQGVLPLWDPYVFGGHSFIGEPQAGLFYPFNLLQAFLIPGDRPLAASDIQWMVALHGFIGAASMYVLARVLTMRRSAALVAAVVFAFGGFVAQRLFGHVSIFYGCVWLPLLLALLHLSITRRRPLLAVAAGVGLGMVVFVGHLMPPVYSAMIMTAYAAYLSFSAWRRRRAAVAIWLPVVMLLIAGAFALGTSAVQTLPSLEYEQVALKWTGTPDPALRGAERSPYSVAGGYYYLHPDQLLSFLMPSLNAPDEGPAYLGILPLFLAVIGIAAGRRKGAAFFALLALVAFLYALGQGSIVHGLMWLSIPILDKARVAVRALYIVSLCIAVLAAWGIEAMLSPDARTRWLVSICARFAGYSLAVLAAIGVGLSVMAKQQSLPGELDFYFSFLIMALLAWIALASWRPLLLAPRLWFLIALSIVLFDLLSYGTSQFKVARVSATNRIGSPDLYYAETGAIRFLKAQPGYFRVDVQNEAISPNFGDVWLLDGVTGHGNTMVEDFLKLRQLAWTPPSPLYDMLNIRYLVTTDTIKTLPLVYNGDVAAGDLKVYENPTALPRAWLVHRVEQVAYGPQTWLRLAQPGFDPSALAIVATPVAVAQGGTGDVVRIAEYTLHALAIEVQTETAALLVTSENYYPGWIVRVDGQPAQVVRVNGGLRGVAVPAGRHDIIFSYQPRSFQIGALVTGATLLLAALLAVGSLLLQRYRLQRLPKSAKTSEVWSSHFRPGTSSDGSPGRAGA
jgi:hypothetical protein